MGIIIKQSIKGSFWSYLGVAVGAVTTMILYPNYLTTEVIGLFGILLAYSVLFSQFSTLGFHGVTNRLFPYFRDNENKHNGFLFIVFITTIIGFVLFLIVFLFLRPILIENNIEKSGLFAEYVDLLVPLTFFSLVFIHLDIYNKVLYNTVMGIFLQEFLQRALIFSITVLFAFHVINLHELIIVYAASVSLKGLLILIYLLIRGKINIKPNLRYIDAKLWKEIGNVALFSILTGVGGSLVFQIDKIIINDLLGLGQTGVYTIAFFFGTLVVIPSRPLLKISGTLIADAFKRNDIAYISDIYKRSCLNQFLIGAFLFGGISININNILVILGPDYAGAKWVIIFIGLGYLFDMMTGANGQIINFSKYYRVSLLFILLLVGLVIATMYLFIPVFGITGAAVAIAASIFINNVLRFIFLKVKYGMQPFTWRIFVIFIILLVAGSISLIIPQMSLILDILVRSVVFSLVFATLAFTLRVSPEANNIVGSLFARIVSAFKRLT